MTCCRVSIRFPLCLNYRVCEMPPVSRCSCGATRVYVALWVFTFQIDHGGERRFASFTSPSIHKDSKNAPIQPARKSFGVFFLLIRPLQLWRCSSRRQTCSRTE